jgi:PHP family Zn ribbon phosphoesterase
MPKDIAINKLPKIPKKISYTTQKEVRAMLKKTVANFGLVIRYLVDKDVEELGGTKLALVGKGLLDAAQGRVSEVKVRDL